MIEFVRPWAFVLLVPTLLVWWWHRRSIAPLRGRRKALAFTLRLAIIIILTTALSEPRWMGQSHDQEVVFLIDRSTSVGDHALKAASELAASSPLQGVRTRWMSFAGKVQSHDDLAAAAAASAENVDPQRTGIGSALGVAAAGFDPGRVKTIVLVSDGNSTEGMHRTDDLRRNEIVVHTVPVNPPDREEVLVQDVNAPASVRTNEPLEIRASIRSTREANAQADLFRNGVRIATQNVSLRKGSTQVRFEDRGGEEKLMFYEVGIRSGADTLAENNQAGAAVLSQGTARTLLITDHPESARYLEWALRQEGIQLSVRPSEGAPDRITDLENFDALIFDNIPASQLTSRQMDLLRSWVRDFGGGFIMLGGDQAYGLGGYFRTAVEDILPVQCDFQKEDETPSLALALVIDRSGSMSGEKIEMAKAAAKASSDLLSPKDYVSVVAFDHEVHPIVQLQSAGDPAGVASRIASITPGGGTNMAPGMEEALHQLAASPAKLKHVIILTDGVSSPGPFEELASRMAQSGITVSTVAAGQDCDTPLLEQIARTGNGRMHQVSDPSAIPQIFTKETMTASKSAIQEFPFLPKPVRAASFLDGIPWESAPFLLGYVRTKAKPTAETWLATERGDPLLTTWRFGLGTTAAFTSDARNRWAVEWLRWPGFGKFWSQLLRRTGRPQNAGTAEASIERLGDGFEVVVDAMDENEGFVSKATGKMFVAAPGSDVQTISLEKVLPGRWHGRFDAEAGGVYTGQALLEKDGKPVSSLLFTATRGFSDEFLMLPANEEFLRQLSRETGGRFRPDPSDELIDYSRTARVERELWSWLALLALILFVIDVAVRRWPQNDSGTPTS